MTRLLRSSKHEQKGEEQKEHPLDQDGAQPGEAAGEPQSDFGRV